MKMAINCGMKTALLLSVFMALPALANSVKLDMVPGLWENNMRYSGEGAAQMQQMQAAQMEAAMADMKQHLASMPPEQRKQMEAMMAQAGMSLSDEGIAFDQQQVNINSDGMSSKSCITQAQINSGDLGMDDGEGCTSTLTQINGNRFKSVQVCTGENASRSEGDIVFNSPKRYTGTGVLTQTIDGQSHRVTVAFEGRWLGGDCGDIPAQ